MKRKNGFALSATIYSLFMVMVLIIFYILYIVTASRTSVGLITKSVEAEINGGGSDPIPTYFEYGYTGDYQTFEVPQAGNYKFELWGASSKAGGSGAYVKGILDLTSVGQKLYVYVGNQPLGNDASFNGGGGVETMTGYFGGGGATDVRTIKGPWNNNYDKRIIVAGGGGSDGCTSLTSSGVNYRCSSGLPGSSASIIKENNDETCNVMQYGENENTSAGINCNAVDHAKGAGAWGATEYNYSSGGDSLRYVPGGACGGGYCAITTRNADRGGAGGSSYVSSSSWCPTLLSSLKVDNYDFTNVDMRSITTTLNINESIPNAYDDDGIYEGVDEYVLKHEGNGRVKITYCGTTPANEC